jgi:subtilisin family serine protease
LLGWACLAAAPALSQIVVPGAIPAPAPAPDSIVSDEIVVVFDELTAAQIEAVGQVLGGANGELPFVGVQAIDELGPALGVSGLRKQFPPADPTEARLAGLPDLSGFYVIHFNPDLATPEQVVAAYLAAPGVVHAEVIGIHPIYATPNDGNYSSQWHLNQASDKDMDAPEAWDIETGDPAIIVAVLDTGVRYYHKDLGGSAASSSNPGAADGNIWINLAEKNGTAGVDDDGNGFIDDWVGYDFVTGLTGCSTGEDCSTADNDPRDFNGHGTHCAGNVAAINNNGYATASPSGGWGNGTLQPTANGSKVMCMRIGWSQSGGGYVRMDFAAQAFYYAADNGARIASCSWGASNSGGVATAINYFLANGGLIFKAAGNANNQTADYMCARSDIYCVAATSQTDAKASFSSYGTWVDISAPGVSIMSTYHNSSDPANDYVASISGTSMATPLTAGAAAAVWSRNPGWTASQVWTQLRDTTDNIDAQNPSYVGLLGSGRVNLYNAVNTGTGCNDNSECDDGDPCNGVETCVGGTCQPGPITDCNSNGIDDGCEPDGDGDGVIDGCDGCPNDGNKTSPGACGCGVPDTDGDGDGTPDCIDGCPSDGNKTSPGQCGCGVPDTDSDGDGVADCNDVCPGGDDNADCDGDGTPDACDPDACPSGPTVLMAFNTATSVPGVGTVENEDIVAYDAGSDTWSLYFDGSDVGLSGFAIDAFDVLGDGTLIFSFTAAGTIGSVSSDDSDLLRFTPTSLGGTTAGTWSMYFDGSDVGLSTNGEDVDAASVLSDGRILISTTDAPTVSGLSGLADEDLIAFTPTSLGSTTAGTWAYYFDGSDVGLATSSNEDVDAAAVRSSGSILLSTIGSFSVASVSGADEDIFEFTPTSLGSSTSGSFSMYLDLSTLGISTDVVAVDIQE